MQQSYTQKICGHFKHNWGFMKFIQSAKNISMQKGLEMNSIEFDLSY